MNLFKCYIIPQPSARRCLIGGGLLLTFVLLQKKDNQEKILETMKILETIKGLMDKQKGFLAKATSTPPEKE